MTPIHIFYAFSALKLLDGRQEEHAACKIIEWWHAGVVSCLQQGADVLHMVQLMPLPPIISCFSKIQIGLTLLVQAYPGCSQKEDIKRVCRYLDSTAILQSISCVDSNRHAREMKSMNDGCKLSAMVEPRSNATDKQQSNIDVYRRGAKRRLSAMSNNCKNYSTHTLRTYYILHESYMMQNVLWSRASVCVSVCPRPHAHTIARTRM